MPRVKRGVGRPQEKEPDMSKKEGRMAQRIRTACAEAGLTRKQVAEACGVSVQTVKSWQCGESIPRFPDAQKLREITGYRLDLNELYT